MTDREEFLTKRLAECGTELENFRALNAEMRQALERSREWAWSDFEGTLEQFEAHPEVKAIDAILAKTEA